MGEGLVHVPTLRPVSHPEARRCRECPAWVEFRTVETTYGERWRPYCLEHDRDHFTCCPGADRIRKELRDRDREQEKRRKEALRADWKKVHPDLGLFDKDVREGKQ